MRGLCSVAAAFRHHTVREGFEVVFVEAIAGGGWRLEGQTAGVEAGACWAVGYSIAVDEQLRTRRAIVTGRSAAGRREVTLDRDDDGAWRIDGVVAPELAGCPDVDLESSACTNALPVARLGLAVGARAEAPAVYVRAMDLRVERLTQTYRRLDERRYDYESPAFDFRAELVYDDDGLVREYPGIATRVR